MPHSIFTPRNIRIRLIYLLFIWGLPLAAHANPILPEFYGVYVLDRGALTELGEDTPEKMRRNFSGKVNFIIFDKSIGAGHLIPKGIKVNKRAFVRKQIVNIVNVPNTPAIQVNVTTASRFVTLTEETKLRFKPVKNEQEMIIAAPKNVMKSGLYTLYVGKQKYFFAVGLGDFTEKDSPLSYCLDEYFQTLNKDAQFTWNNYMIQSTSREGYIDGNKIVKSSFKPCVDFSEDAFRYQSSNQDQFEDSQASKKSNESSDLLTIEDLTQGEKNSEYFAPHSRTLNASFQNVWNAVSGVFNSQGEKIIRQDKKLGVIVTDFHPQLPISHPRSGKYFVLLKELSEKETEISLKLFSYYRAKGDSEGFVRTRPKTDVQVLATVFFERVRTKLLDSPEVMRSAIDAVVPGGKLGEFRHGTLVSKNQAGELVTADDNGSASYTHPGVDIVAPANTPIKSIVSGEITDVITSESDPDFEHLGYMVIVQHNKKIRKKPTYSIYMHMISPPPVTIGKKISIGDELGRIGDTGNAKGYHTHVEIRHFASRYLKKYQWNKPWNIYGKGNLSSKAIFKQNWENPEMVIGLLSVEDKPINNVATTKNGQSSVATELIKSATGAVLKGVLQGLFGNTK